MSLSSNFSSFASSATSLLSSVSASLLVSLHENDNTATSDTNVNILIIRFINFGFCFQQRRKNCSITQVAFSYRIRSRQHCKRPAFLGNEIPITNDIFKV